MDIICWFEKYISLISDEFKKLILNIMISNFNFFNLWINIGLKK